MADFSRNWKRHAVKALRIASQTLDVAVHFRGFSPFSLAATAVKAADAYFGGQSGPAILQDCEELPIPTAFARRLHQALEGKSKVVYVGERTTLSEAHIDDVKIIVSVNSNSYIDFFADSGQKEVAYEKLLSLLWGNSTVIRIVPAAGVSAMFDDIAISDCTLEVFPSPTAETLVDYLREFQKRGIGRKVLLHGPPGVGKSCVAQYAASKIGAKTLFVSLGMLNADNFSATVAALKPDFIILDDFDRTDTGGAFLTEIERIKNAIVVVTTNTIDGIDPAVLRPGRFDDIFELQQLDSSYIKSLVSEFEPEIAAKLVELPVAYIQNYVQLREIFGSELAEEKLEEMIVRAESINAAFAPEEEYSEE